MKFAQIADFEVPPNADTTVPPGLGNAIKESLDSNHWKGTAMNMANWKKYGTRSVIQTQAMMKFNSGKRVRHICLVHYEDTGESTMKKPRKFLPAQALRRNAA